MNIIQKIKLSANLIKVIATGKIEKLFNKIVDGIKSEVKELEKKGDAKKETVILIAQAYIMAEINPISPLLAYLIIGCLPTIIEKIYTLLKTFVDGLTEKL